MKTIINRKKKNIFQAILSFSITITFIGGMIANPNQALGASFTFLQTDWSGGQTANVANHASNQTGWSQYSAKDANISTGADLTLTNTPSSSNMDFNSTTEGNFIQQDAANGTDFGSTNATLHTASATFGDDFSNASIDTNRWTVTPSGGTASIVSGQLKLATSAPNQNPTLTHKGIVGAGNFDVQVDFSNVVTTSGSWWATLQFTSNDGLGNMQDNIGQMGYYSRIYQNGAINYLITSRFDTSGKLRLTRIGTTGTVYAWYNSTWNVLYTHATTDGPGYFSLYSGTTLSTVSCNFDNFTATGNLTNPSSYPTSQAYYITTGSGSQKNTSAWNGISGVALTQTTPANTNLKYLVSFDNRSTWKYWNGSSWQTSTLGNIPTYGMTKSTIEAIAQAQWSASGGFTPGTLDFAANLSTTDGTVTPSISQIQVNSYSYPSSQTLTSSPYNIQSANGSLSKLQWTESLPTNTDIKFQLRTSPDGTNWGAWCGPDNGVQGTCNSSTYFTDPSGGETIDDIQRDKSNDQYFQYKVFLSSSDGLNTPTLSDVSVSYADVSSPTVSTLAASSITPTFAQANGNVTSTGGDNPSRYIEWGTTSGNYTDSCSAGIGSTGTYSCNMTSLSPNTTYYYRTKATNSAGTTYGAETSFTTSVAIPNVTTSSVTSISSNSATGNGNVANVGGENPTRYIEWGTSSGNYSTGSCNASTGSTGAYSCSITGLSPNTTYYVRAKAANSAGTSFGSETSFTTAIDKATITTQSASSILADSAQGNGSIINTNGENPQRFIEWGTSSGNYSLGSCNVGIGGTGTYSCSMTNLFPDTIYYYRAKATNSAGTSYGSETSFTTLPDSVTITDPTPTKMNSAVSSSYVKLNSGSITSTPLVTTNTTLNIQDGVVKMTIPQNTQITNTDSGNFNFQNFIATQANVKATVLNSISAVKIGVPNTKLTFSQPITLSIDVDPAYNGRTLDVFYQNDGESAWHSQTSCTITNGKCTFTTTHATTYTVNGSGNMAGETGVNLNTDVQEIISLDCGNTSVNLQNLTPGTPVTGTSICTATTNANGGYSLSVKRDSATSTLSKNSEKSTTIPDKTEWDPTANTNQGNASTWSGIGLGFTIFNSSATKDSNWWGTGSTVNDSNNKYAGFSPTQTDIMNHNSYSDVSTATSIGYKLDVSPSQKSGAYSGNITYQVVTRP